MKRISSPDISVVPDQILTNAAKTLKDDTYNIEWDRKKFKGTYFYEIWQDKVHFIFIDEMTRAPLSLHFLLHHFGCLKNDLN